MNSILEERLKQIQAMPEGPEKTAAIAELTRDYEGQTALAQGNLTNANKALAQAMTMPQARTAGPSSNPFAVAVAPNPMEYLAKGLQGYMANKNRRAAQGELESLSGDKSRSLGALMRAGIGNRDEEDEEELRRLGITGMF